MNHYIDIVFCCNRGRTLEKYLLALLLLFSCSSIAFAEHEANHRYLISGHVRDAIGKPLENVAVSLAHKGGKKKKVTTDDGGYYESRFHLHNQNHGDTIVVIALGTTKRIKVQFDPKDEVNFRGATVDFGAASSDDAPIWTFLTIASLVLLSGTVYFGLIKKKSVLKSPEKVKKKKKKRKK